MQFQQLCTDLHTMRHSKSCGLPGIWTARFSYRTTKAHFCIVPAKRTAIIKQTKTSFLNSIKQSHSNKQVQITLLTHLELRGKMVGRPSK